MTFLFQREFCNFKMHFEFDADIFCKSMIPDQFNLFILRKNKMFGLDFGLLI